MELYNASRAYVANFLKLLCDLILSWVIFRHLVGFRYLLVVSSCNLGIYYLGGNKIYLNEQAINDEAQN